MIDPLTDFAAWCDEQRALLGAVDGYDYRSGEEYGLRRAQIEAERRASLSPAPAGGWQDIEALPRHQGVILCFWWEHSPLSPFVAEGYLDWDGITWRLQNGDLPQGKLPPTHWQPLPAPSKAEGE
jgi:hypothetical protein